MFKYNEILVSIGVSLLLINQVNAYEPLTVIIKTAPEERIYAPEASSNYQFLVSQKQYVEKGDYLVSYYTASGDQHLIGSPLHGYVNWVKEKQGLRVSISEGELVAKVTSQRRLGMVKLDGLNYGEHFQYISLCIGTVNYKTNWLGNHYGWGLFELSKDFPLEVNSAQIIAELDSERCAEKRKFSLKK